MIYLYQNYLIVPLLMSIILYVVFCKSNTKKLLNVLSIFIFLALTLSQNNFYTDIWVSLIIVWCFLLLLSKSFFEYQSRRKIHRHISNELIYYYTKYFSYYLNEDEFIFLCDNGKLNSLKYKELKLTRVGEIFEKIYFFPEFDKNTVATVSKNRIVVNQVNIPSWIGVVEFSKFVNNRQLDKTWDLELNIFEKTVWFEWDREFFLDLIVNQHRIGYKVLHMWLSYLSETIYILDYGFCNELKNKGLFYEIYGLPTIKIQKANESIQEYNEDKENKLDLFLSSA